LRTVNYKASRVLGLKLIYFWKPNRKDYFCTPFCIHRKAH